jgi:hypothetical protein
MAIGPNVAYATQADVYTYGLPRGALGNPGRILDSLLAATSTATLAEHGFSTGSAITFRVTQGGALSAPLIAGTTYYAIYLTDSTFQIAASPTGSAITLTTDSIQAIVSADLPFADVLLFYSRFVDGFLPAHAVPLPTPYPITVIAIVAELAAKRLQILSGLVSESMKDLELSAKAQLERWAATLPVRDADPSTQPANLAVTKARHDNRLGYPLYGQGPGGLWGGWGGWG